MGERRFYRAIMARSGLVSFRVVHKETDLYVQAPLDLSLKVSSWVIQARQAIELYIQSHPEFLSSRSPLAFDPFANPIIKQMLEAGIAARVGPMAAVAGAIAEFIGRNILEQTPGEVIVENGGDVFLTTKSPVTISIFAGPSPLSNKIAVKLDPKGRCLGVCTSSGTVGHSLSLGRADAVTVIAHSAALADAMATSAANLVKKKSDIKLALKTIKDVKGVLGGVVIKGDRLGAVGQIEIIPIT